MKAVLFVICGICLANIVVATFIWPPTTKALGTPAPVVNAATLQGQDPWMVNERYNAPNRERTRKATLETLDKPWASYCTTEGHEFLIRAINYYYGERGAEAWSYGHAYGEVARRFAIKAWTTPDDNRIERLMGETYGRGYFSLDELRSSARETLAAQLRACESIGFCVFRHESNQGLRTRRNVELPIHSHPLRSVHVSANPCAS